MTMPFPVLAIPLLGQLVVALAMLAIPHITRRDLLFGVTVPEGFRATEAGLRALRIYRLQIIIAAVLSVLAILAVPDPRLLAVAALLLTAVGIAAFVAQNRELKPYAIQPPLVREATVGPPEPLPWFTWLGILPLLLLAGSAMYLNSHWDRIPERFPVHFGIDGAPNRWAARTVRGVYGPLMLGGEIAVWLFGLALAGWYGSRRSDPIRKPALVVMLAAEWIVALLFGVLPLRLATGIAIPIPMLLLGPLALLIPAMAYAIRESNKPRDPIDPTTASGSLSIWGIDGVGRSTEVFSLFSPRCRSCSGLSLWRSRPVPKMAGRRPAPPLPVKTCTCWPGAAVLTWNLVPRLAELPHV
jgi:hypothetical protein